MNWAWTQDLPTTPKFVLMALADAADDDGECYPSHKWLGRKCNVSDRTVRRVLALLQHQGLLLVQSRFHGDGARTSNRYRLRLGSHPQDKMSRGVVMDD